MGKRYLDYEGLGHYDYEIKEWVKKRLRDYEDLTTMLYDSVDSIKNSPHREDILYVTLEGKMYAWFGNLLKTIGGKTDLELADWLVDTLVNNSSVLNKDGDRLFVAIDKEQNENNYLKVSNKGIYISGIEEYVNQRLQNDVYSKMGVPNGFATLDSNGKVEQDHYILTPKEVDEIDWFHTGGGQK